MLFQGIYFYLKNNNKQKNKLQEKNGYFDFKNHTESYADWTI